MAFQKFKDTGFVEQVHIFGLSNIHTFEIDFSPTFIIFQILCLSNFKFHFFKCNVLIFASILYYFYCSCK